MLVYSLLLGRHLDHSSDRYHKRPQFAYWDIIGENSTFKYKILVYSKQCCKKVGIKRYVEMIDEVCITS